MARLKEDAEWAALKAELKVAMEAPVKVGTRIAVLSQESQKKQFEKIVGLYPDLASYLEAKANHQKERAALLREYADDAAAKAAIVEGTKRVRRSNQ